jgi:hypothetical protein
MKIPILSLCLLLASTLVFSQRNSKVDPKDLQIDSLSKATKSLTLKLDSVTKQLDSVSGELVKYLGLYNTIREKVIHYPFDPTRSAYLIDSLAAKRDSTSALLALNQKPSVSPNDTIKAAQVLQPFVPVTAEELERAKALGCLKQLKELLDTKIITDVEFVTLKKKYLEKL